MNTRIGFKKSSRTVIILSSSLLVCCLLISALPSFASADGLAAGNIESIERDSPSSTATIVRSGKPGNVTANIGDSLFKGDRLQTGAGVKAQIALPDGSTIHVGPDSNLEMKDHLLNPSEGKRSYSIKALKGTMRFIIAKLFRNRTSGAETPWNKSNITIETTTAIAGIRGTDFAVTVEAAEVEIAVFEGMVSLRSMSASIKGDVMLGANQISRVMKGLSPGAPSALLPQQRERLLRQTTPAKFLQMLQKAPGSTGKKDNKALKRSIAKDVAAGVPLKDIIKNAVKEGVSISSVIIAAIEAGVDPSQVVYTAIAEGYSAQTVVSQALTQGASLEVVINAAADAGADSKAIYAGAAAAGAPPAAVANLISTIGAPGEPVFGYTAPADTPPPSVYTPPDPVTVGGGGGETPSTQPASPYVP